MAFKFIHPTATGYYQSILNRVLVSSETLKITDTPGGNSNVAIPMDGIDDQFILPSHIWVGDTPDGATANNLSLACRVKQTIPGIGINPVLNFSILRSISATTTDFDGIYGIYLVKHPDTNSGSYVDFRVYHDKNYSLTSATTLSTGDWHHVWCQYSSGDSANSYMQIFLDGTLSCSGIIGDPEINEVSQYQDDEKFGGIIDEIQLWIATGVAASINISNSTPEINPSIYGIGNLSKYTEKLVGWWRLESTDEEDLFNSTVSSIKDYSSSGYIDATPSGFTGTFSGNLANVHTIVMGMSASGDLLYKADSGGAIDHGGLTVVSPENGTIITEPGSENLVNSNIWNVYPDSITSSVQINRTTNNILYGSSAVNVVVHNKLEGLEQIVTNNLFNNNEIFTASLHMKAITGSTCALVSFITRTVSVDGPIVTTASSTAVIVANSADWKQVVISSTGSDLSYDESNTAIVRVQSLNESSASFVIDGLQIREGGNILTSFIPPTRIRKASQLSWEISN